MKSFTLSLVAFFCVLSAGKAQAQLELPSLNVFNYQAAARDPFISAQAQTTLFDRGVEVRGIVSGDAVQQYLETVVAAIKAQLFVGGVSVGDKPQNCEAIINGIGFRTGDMIPLPLDPTQLNRLVELSRSYGLPLQLSNDGTISLLVGRISAFGVSLLLPGFQASLYQLPLESSTQPDPVRLEHRPKNH
jgi:hypothetical protein